MSSKWKNRQRRSEIRTRQSGRRHGASGEVEELVSGFCDLDTGETGTLTKHQVLIVMRNKGYSEEYSEQYFEFSENNKDDMITLEEFKEKLKSCPIAILESELTAFHDQFESELMRSNQLSTKSQLYLMVLSLLHCNVQTACMRIARLKRLFYSFDKSGEGLNDTSVSEFVDEAEKLSRIFRNDLKPAVSEVTKFSNTQPVMFKSIETYLRTKGSHFNASEEISLENAFRAIDRDNNGQLTLDEIVDMMERRGYPPVFARVFLDALDEDGDFVVSLEEFKRMLMSNPIHNLDSDLAQMHRLFRIFDKDSNGFIEEHDLKSYIEEAEQISPYFSQAVKKAIEIIDLNKDGRISFEELSEYIRKKVPIAPHEEEEYLEKRFIEVAGSDSENLDIKTVSKLMYDEGYRQNLTKVMTTHRFLNDLVPENNKVMSLGEFKTRMREYPIPLEAASYANLNRLFNILDSDQRGSILDEDLISYINESTHCLNWFRETLKPIITKLDRSQDKRISYRQLSDNLRSASRQLSI